MRCREILSGCSERAGGRPAGAGIFFTTPNYG
jgi:hypothetical protein